MPDSEEEFLRKLRAAFEVEAREHLQVLSTGLLELEKSPPASESAAIVERTFRAAHSLKGAARSVDRREIEAVCQSLESVFARWKNAGVDSGRDAFDALNVAVARVEEMLSSSPPSAAPAPAAPLVSVSIPPALPVAPQPPLVPDIPSSTPAGAAPTVRVPMARMDALLRQVEEMSSLKNSARQRSADLLSLRRSIREWRTDSALFALSQRATAAAGDRPVFIDRVRGWLQACDTRLARLEEQITQDRRLLGTLVDGLLEDARTLAMLPFSTVLDYLPRQARELARAQGKIAELTLRGGEIEIDKRILEQIKDPLLHLVRNCTSHGIEPPAVRRAYGKPETGHIVIQVCYQNAAQVEVTVSDDGPGIDEPRLVSAALAAGLVTPAEAAGLSGPEALKLIFRSGLSTAETPSEISGRGLGMAIVTERVEDLGGTVNVESRPGEGALFRIVLPISFANFSGVLVECGGESLVVPAANIERAIRIPRSQIQRSGTRETIPWAGQSLPLSYLRTLLGIRSKPARLSSDTVQALILVSGHVRIACAVDQVTEQMELLLKPFQRPILHARHFAAAAVLPSGRAALILNVPEVIDSAITLGNERAAAGPDTPPLPKQGRDILVVDDSVTSRMLLKNILETAGYRVRTASDGLDALTALRTQRFDLVVSDVQMPRMNGFDLAANIRADRNLTATPVVLVTALESAPDRARGVEAGASAYIVKGSFDQSNLLKTVGSLI